MSEYYVVLNVERVRKFEKNNSRYVPLNDHICAGNECAE